MTQPPRSRHAVKRRHHVALSADEQAALRLLIEKHGLDRETDAKAVQRALEGAATGYRMLVRAPHLPPQERRRVLEQGRRRAESLLEWIHEHGSPDALLRHYIFSGIEGVLAGQDPFAPGFISEATAWNHFKNLRHGLAVLIVSVRYLTTRERKESQAQTDPLEYLIGALQCIWEDCKMGRAAIRNNIKDNPGNIPPFRRFVDDVIRIMDRNMLRRVEHASRALNAGRRQLKRDAQAWERRKEKEKVAEARERARLSKALSPKRKPTKKELREIERQMERIFPVPSKAK